MNTMQADGRRRIGMEDFLSPLPRGGDLLHPAVLLFLKQVWGPAFHYDYSGLTVEPVSGAWPEEPSPRGRQTESAKDAGQRRTLDNGCVELVYIRGQLKLRIELIELTAANKDAWRGASEDDYAAYLTRHNELVLSGWLVLRFTAQQLEKRPQQCQAHIKQAIGHWWAMTKEPVQTEDTDIWTFRKRLLIRMAQERSGVLKPRDVAEAFQMTSRAAGNWLKRFQAEGVFTGVASKQNRLTRYKLNSVIAAHPNEG